MLWREGKVNERSDLAMPAEIRAEPVRLDRGPDDTTATSHGTSESFRAALGIEASVPPRCSARSNLRGARHRALLGSTGDADHDAKVEPWPALRPGVLDRTADCCVADLHLSAQRRADRSADPVGDHGCDVPKASWRRPDTIGLMPCQSGDAGAECEERCAAQGGCGDYGPSASGDQERQHGHTGAERE